MDNKGVFHELGNVLALLSGHMDLLAGTPLSEEQDKFVKRLYGDLEKIKGVLTREPEKAKVFMHPYLQELTESCEVFTLPKGLALKAAADMDEEAAFLLEEGKLSQILVNLVKNAAKFTDQGEISIFVRENREDGRQVLVFTVEDTGCGIAESSLAWIFEPYVSLNPSIEGTGLGLAVCRELVEGMEGRIWAENREDGGGRFCFTLPAMRI